MTDGFPPKIGAPATRALGAAGITSPDDLAQWTEARLLALHGMGPKAVAILRAALAARGRDLSGTDPPTPTPTRGAGAVDAHLASVASPQRAALAALRKMVRAILPRADEAITYGMPSFVVDGKGIVGYAAFTDHWSYFPMSGGVILAAGEALSGYKTSKGGIRLGVDERLPVALVRRLVQLRLAELAAVTDGRRCECYRDGQVKAVGPMKAGQLHGSWTWYRRDGTVMRTGRFAHGERTGTWTTWDRAGNVVTTSRC